MRNTFLLLLCLFGCASLIEAQQPVSLKKMDAPSFYANIGAKYAATEKQWQLPATAKYLQLFDNGDSGPFEVVLDSILFRPVGDKEEAWVLFRASKVVYNFARYEKTAAGWQRKALHYNIYNGPPGEYSTDVFGFAMIGTKTYINVLETYNNRFVNTTNWILIDPFDPQKRSSLKWARIGEKEDSANQYEEYETTGVQYGVVPGGMPDITLTQKVEVKTKGKPVQKLTRTLKYAYDVAKKEYFLKR